MLVSYLAQSYIDSTGMQARRQQIFVLAPPPPPPPDLLFVSHGCFWRGKSCWLGPEKAFGFRRRPFFFWRSLVFGRKKTLKFRPEKAFGNRRKPLLPDFNFAPPPPPPISRSWRRPCRYGFLVSNTGKTIAGLL